MRPREPACLPGKEPSVRRVRVTSGWRAETRGTDRRSKAEPVSDHQIPMLEYKTRPRAPMNPRAPCGPRRHGSSEERWLVSLVFLTGLQGAWGQKRRVVDRRAELVFGDIEQEMPVAGLVVRLVADEQDVVSLRSRGDLGQSREALGVREALLAESRGVV